MEVAANILAIEDSKYVQKFLQSAFSAPGLSLSLATNLKEAFQKIRESVPDLILTDVFLPDGNALDHVSRFREAAGRTIPVIAMSGSDALQLEETARKNGCDAWLSKPLPFADLVLTIGRCLGDQDASEDAGEKYGRNGSPKNSLYY